ncbi:protein NO VEIN domain-containing protein [Caulobacter sp. UNC279MFTsu5.1]|uniref:protein NO VEIN domain-containing protein n=1 Tax=Caulobacter sp. UNC279MFTsu5.1 TaxID=1502775 RepID=UPI00037EE981|nr:DUF3883 domain-containing protein [Caulobacter sp. UNC279MFTsu5.1]SFK73076.1 protein of unknown function [Caulobacter sp. UNC279MFTsu5.1]
MGDSAINGRTWNEAEQDLVVGDYLVMLDKVMTGRALDPANHQRALRFVTNRSGGAITFLQGEISAVLTLIGLPTLNDHPPRWDFGDGLVDSVDRCLSARPAVLKALAQPPALLGRAAAPILTEGAPPPVALAPPGARAERLVAKFDPAARDQEARMLARIGVAAALVHEQRRLEDRGRPDLAAQVRLALPTDPEGCDLVSFSRTGAPRLIAVKTTTGGPAAPFRLTPAEEILREAQPEAFVVHRLYDVAREARVFRVRGAREGAATA